MADRKPSTTENAQRWTYEGRPLRAVVKASPMAGRGGLLGGDTMRRRFWWVLRLECGHRVERDMRYRPLRPDEQPIRGGRTNRKPADRLPPPKSARCDECPQVSENPTPPAKGADDA